MKSSVLTMSEATDANAVEWNAFVESQSHGSVFHLWEWREFYRLSCGHEAPYLIARDEQGVRGVLPLVRVKSLVFGHYLVSLPYVSYGGPLGDPEAQRALTRRVSEIALGAKLVELRSRQEIATDLSPTRRKITVVLDIVPGDYETTFRRFDSKLRSQIRRGERDGISVRFGADGIADFHRVFAEHMRDLGSPAHGVEFFRDLAEMLGERAWVGVAYLGETPIAGGFAIENGAEVEISWASSLRRYQKQAPNMALYGAFIRRACERGFSAFNFGRCTEGSGTHRFKKQWGSRDEPLPWYQLRTGAIAEPPNPTSGGFSIATAVWRRLPLSLTTPLGARLIRGLP